MRDSGVAGLGDSGAGVQFRFIKQKGALMLVSSTAVESMGMGGMLGAAALRQSQLSEKGSAGSPSAPTSGGAL